MTSTEPAAAGIDVFGQADRPTPQAEYVVLDRRGHLLVYADD